jgi:predicted Rossmann fold flavoprotein
VIEHNTTVGKKIRISGGGRCNFTNIHTDPERYLSDNPRFCYSALSKYTPSDFVAFVEKHGIAYHEKKLGQLFCDGSAQQIIDALLKDCAEAGVEIRCDCGVEEVRREDGYIVDTTQGEFRATALVVATGGLSIPRMGASDLGYRVAAQFGMNIVSCEPGLVPFVVGEEGSDGLSDLSGISFDALVSIGKTAFEEAVLITHRGLSGPAILQISSYWKEGDLLTLDLFPGVDLGEELLRIKGDAPKTTPKSYLRRRFSSRFALRLCDRNGWQRSFGEMPDAEVRAMAESLQRWTVAVDDTEGYAKAEVTRGGVDTRGLSPKTMEARDVPRLYFIGEVMDVTGWLGGYNFQWAWASAAAAGSAV